MIPVYKEEYDISELSSLQKQLTVKEFASKLNLSLDIATNIADKLEFSFRKRKKPVVKLPNTVEIIDEVTLD